jgi:hypothetical protein
VAARSKAWVCRSSNPAGGMFVCCDCCACCKVEVSATGPSLIQTSPIECGVSECDREASAMRRRRPTRAVER